jgi:hypothetical protein
MQLHSQLLVPGGLQALMLVSCLALPAAWKWKSDKVPALVFVVATAAAGWSSGCGLTL